MSLQEKVELGFNRKKTTICDYVQKGLYVIMRKCPTAHNMFGHDTGWDLTTLEYGWMIENLSEEFKPEKK